MTILMCEACGKSWPEEHFPEIGDRSLCEFCLGAGDAKKAMQKIEDKTKELTDKLLDATSGETFSMPKVRDVVSAIYRELGGPVGFAQKFAFVITDLMSRDKVPSTAGSLMMAFAKIHLNVEAKDESADISKMTDEQIRREQELMFMQLLLDASRNPDSMKLVTDALANSGMKVVDGGVRDRIAEIQARAESL